MEKYLIIVGASIFGTLGTFHLLFTFFTNKFEAHDPTVTEAMKGTSPNLTKDTSMWRAWIGFNASHSLGAMLFAGMYIPLASHHIDVIRHSLWLSVLPVLTGLSYLVLAKRYWFKIPLIGIAIATLCFTAAAVLIIV